MTSPAPHGGGCKSIPSPFLGWVLDTTATLQSSTHRLGVGEQKGSLRGAHGGPTAPLLWQPGTGLAVTARYVL